MGRQMRRRDFITGIAGSTVAWTLAGLADIVDERVKLEIETVPSELLEMYERLGRGHDTGMIARDLEQGLP